MKIKRLWIVLLVMILCFIWGNSLLSKEASGELSNSVAKALASVFGLESVDESGMVEGTGMLRKIAHFLEFCALGAVSFCLAGQLISSKGILALILSLEGILVAFLDETIQIFSLRGPQIKDMWIDLSGFAVGCLLAVAVKALALKIKSSRSK